MKRWRQSTSPASAPIDPAREAARATVLGIGLLAACSAAEILGALAYRRTAPVRPATALVRAINSSRRISASDLSGQFSLDGEGYQALPVVGGIGARGRQLGDEIESG